MLGEQQTPLVDCDTDSDNTNQPHPNKIRGDILIKGKLSNKDHVEEKRGSSEPSSTEGQENVEEKHGSSKLPFAKGRSQNMKSKSPTTVREVPVQPSAGALLLGLPESPRTEREPLTAFDRKRKRPEEDGESDESDERSKRPRRDDYTPDFSAEEVKEASPDPPNPEDVWSSPLIAPDPEFDAVARSSQESEDEAEESKENVPPTDTPSRSPVTAPTDGISDPPVSNENQPDGESPPFDIDDSDVDSLYCDEPDDSASGSPVSDDDHDKRDARLPCNMEPFSPTVTGSVPASPRVTTPVPSSPNVLQPFPEAFWDSDLESTTGNSSGFVSRSESPATLGRYSPYSEYESGSSSPRHEAMVSSEKRRALYETLAEAHKDQIDHIRLVFEQWQEDDEKEAAMWHHRHEDYLLKHNGLSEYSRFLLVNWMSEFCGEKRYERRSFHLAVNFVDLYLSKSSGMEAGVTLQIFALAMVGLACKQEQDHEMQLNSDSEHLFAFSYAEDMDEASIRKIVKDAERMITKYQAKMLKYMDWDIDFPTAIEYLHRYHQQGALYRNISKTQEDKENQAEKETPGHRPKYVTQKQFSDSGFAKAANILDAAMGWYGSIKYRGSVLAAAVFHVTFAEENAELTELVTGYTPDHLENCLKFLDVAATTPVFGLNDRLKYVEKMHKLEKKKDKDAERDAEVVHVHPMQWDLAYLCEAYNSIECG
ncbi:hypothetical protein HK104_011235 [Borealophlyctis nickersoniae]|nr:hypothetical protein HK104_011235 [Borealophlyctis nickersoniae]